MYVLSFFAGDELPDSFFELTESDIRKMWADLQSKYVSQHSIPLARLEAILAEKSHCHWRAFSTVETSIRANFHNNSNTQRFSCYRLYVSAAARVDCCLVTLWLCDRGDSRGGEGGHTHSRTFLLFSLRAESEAPLLTVAMRQQQQEARMDRYPRVIMRVHFPERVVLQGVFNVRESGERETKPFMFWLWW